MQVFSRRKLSFFLVLFFSFVALQYGKAQETDSDSLKTETKVSKKKAVKAVKEKKEKVNQFANIDLSQRPHDHLIIKYGPQWFSGANDTTTTHGFSRAFSIQLMYDKPFVENPHLSLGLGLGFTNNNFFFKDRYLNIKAQSSTLPFTNVAQSSTNRFKRFKLALNYLEIPVEFRYADNIEAPQNGFKAAIGVKLGWLVSAYTKGKNQINSAGQSIYDGSYTIKEMDKHFFRSAMLTGTGRIGFGAFSLFGDYSILGIIKGGAGPTLRPFTIGLAVSGL